MGSDMLMTRLSEITQHRKTLTFTCALQVSMPHQWLEGNLPVSAKCTVCDKTCGSVLRLQDWRCLWCKAMVSKTHLQLQTVPPLPHYHHHPQMC